jgi:hypothetical protein
VVVEAGWIHSTHEARARKDDKLFRLDFSEEQQAELAERNRSWARGKRKQPEGDDGGGGEQQGLVAEKLVIKGQYRGAVDPVAGEEQQQGSHVFDEGGGSETTLYDFLGNLTNIKENVNSY